MALKPAKACRFPNCPELTREGYCHNHKDYEKAVIKSYETRREHDPFYTSPEWIRARAIYKRQHPLCEECKTQGRITPMKIVDHIIPIRKGGQRLDQTNFRSLCQECHNRKTGEDRKS